MSIYKESEVRCTDQPEQLLPFSDAIGRLRGVEYQLSQIKNRLAKLRNVFLGDSPEKNSMKDAREIPSSDGVKGQIESTTYTLEHQTDSIMALIGELEDRL